MYRYIIHKKGQPNVTYYYNTGRPPKDKTHLTKMGENGGSSRAYFKFYLFKHIRELLGSSQPLKNILKAKCVFWNNSSYHDRPDMTLMKVISI